MINERSWEAQWGEVRTEQEQERSDAAACEQTEQDNILNMSPMFIREDLWERLSW